LSVIVAVFSARWKPPSLDDLRRGQHLLCDQTSRYGGGPPSYQPVSAQRSAFVPVRGRMGTTRFRCSERVRVARKQHPRPTARSACASAPQPLAIRGKPLEAPRAYSSWDDCSLDPTGHLPAIAETSLQ
jgi:hypothetical protein